VTSFNDVDVSVDIYASPDLLLNVCQKTYAKPETPRHWNA